MLAAARLAWLLISWELVFAFAVTIVFYAHFLLDDAIAKVRRRRRLEAAIKKALPNLAREFDPPEGSSTPFAESDRATLTDLLNGQGPTEATIDELDRQRTQREQRARDVDNARRWPK